MARNVKQRQFKISKIAIVMFLTILIWVYSDLAVDDTLSVTNVPISIAKSTDAELWVAFKNEDGPPLSTVTIKQVVLKGPSSRIAEVKRQLSNNLLNLALSLNPEMQNMDTPGSYALNVLDFVRNSEQTRTLGGLTVEACEPSTLTVDVVKLVQRNLSIKSFDENKRIIESESITPSEITMYVPEDWGQDKVAEVMLTQAEINKARLSAITKSPYIELEDNQKRFSNGTVKVKLVPEEDELKTYQISRVTVGFCFSVNTQGKYKVETDMVIPQITIRATPEAKQAYEAEAYKAILEIRDGDEDAADWLTRGLKYNFPEIFVQNGEIKLDPEYEPVEAKFKLVPVPSAESP